MPKRHFQRWGGIAYAKDLFDGLEQVQQEVRIEIVRARKKHGDFHSMHEATAVIREEFEEWWDSVKGNDPDPMELIQLAAMAEWAAVVLMQSEDVRQAFRTDTLSFLTHAQDVS